MDKLEKFRHMWTTQKGEYVLVMAEWAGDMTEVVCRAEDLSPVNIGDYKLWVQVVREMRQAGCKVIWPKPGERPFDPYGKE